MSMDFTFSDTIAGYVTDFDSGEGRFGLRTSDGRLFQVHLTPTTYARFTRNLGESYQDATSAMPQLLALPRQFLHVYGTFYPGLDGRLLAQWIVFAGDGPGKFRHEAPDWWINQARSIGRSYLAWQFGHPAQEIDYRNYRTRLQLEGGKKGDFLQETDTISRLVYGFASAFLLTGEDSFLEAAEKGTQYLRDHMRFFDPDENLIYWYHGIQVDRPEASRSCSPRNSATTSTRSRCTSRFTPWPARSQTFRDHRRPEDPDRHREHVRLVRPVSIKDVTAADTSRTSTR